MCLKTGLYKKNWALFPPTLCSLSTYIRQQWIRIYKKIKGFLSTKRLYLYQSVKSCGRDGTVPRGKGKNHPWALETGRQDSPRHGIEQGVSRHFLLFPSLATLLVGPQCWINFLYAHGIICKKFGGTSSQKHGKMLPNLFQLHINRL